ncbi:hypothetical protein FQZ97_785930 [compost metagenome]
MHPELVEQVQRPDGEEHQRRYPGDGHRQVKDPADEKAGTGLPQSGGKVVLLALVMHRMGGPEQVALVAQAVIPVVAEVIEDKGQQPDPGALRRQLEERQVLPGEAVGEKPHHLGQQAAGGGQHPGTQAVQAIGGAVAAHPAPTIGQQLDADQEKEERHCVEHVIHGAALSLCVSGDPQASKKVGAALAA